MSVVLLGTAGFYLARGEFWKSAGWLANALAIVPFFYNDYQEDLPHRPRVRNTGIEERCPVCGPLTAARTCSTVQLLWLMSTPRARRSIDCGALLSRQARQYGSKMGCNPLETSPANRTPIFVVGKLFDYWLVIDQTLVLKLGGTRMMGLYAVVTMSTTALSTVPGAVNQVLYPRMTQKFGEGQTLRQLAYGYAKPIAASVAAVTPIVLFGWWLIGPVTRFLIPQYGDAVPAMQWALLLAP